jgi:hypothetical protein
MGMKKTQGKKPLRREQRINVAPRVFRHVAQILQVLLIPPDVLLIYAKFGAKPSCWLELALASGLGILKPSQARQATASIGTGERKIKPTRGTQPL